MPYLGNEVAPLVQALEGKELKLDNDGDSSITADTDDRVDVKVGGSDKVHITSTGLGIGTNSPSNLIELDSGSGTDSGISIRMGTGNSGANDSFIAFENSAGSEIIRTRYDNPLTSYVISSDTSGDIMSVLRTGIVGINNSSPSGCKLEVSYANADVGMVVSTTDTFSSGNSSLIQFKEVDTVGGSIVFTNGGSSTAYAQSSDYRLKENVTYEFDATTRLKELKPCRFNFKKTPDITVDGFLAHEVTAVPEAIIGEKDAVDKDGNIEAQQIDQAKLVPLLTKALQEAVAKIETLEAEVAKLKG